MTIIDDISYSTTVSPDIPNKIILQFPLNRRKTINQRSIGGKFRKMFSQNDNNIIRPRKFQNSWVNQNKVKNSGQIFKIGEFFPEYHKESEEVLTLPKIETDIKYKKKMEQPSSGLLNKIFYYFEIYCDKSTLHGLKYVGDSSISLFERLFWFVAFIAAIAFASFYISNIYQKWNENPVIVSFSASDVSLLEIPFPSITICNMNQAKKSEAERILREGTESERKLLNDYCTSNNSFTEASKDAPDWTQIQNFLFKVGQSCSIILRSCKWKSDPVSCDDFFNNVLTDEGLCCSFNRLPDSLIFHNSKDLAILNQTYPSNVYDWTPERGFPNKISEDYTIPRRPLGAGSHLGLTVIVDAKIADYFCSSTDSMGFKVQITNPIETPKMADYGFLISPGTEARYIIKPEVRIATEALRSVAIAKRKCYFNNERPLYYYRTYTSKNCRLECQSNYTLQKCNCIPYFLPRSKYVKVCGKRDEVCSTEAKEDMELTYGNGSNCHCLPSCYELNFAKTASYSKLAKLISYKHDFEDINQDYFVKNMVVMHFFFGESKFAQTVKSEIFGFTELLSNVGGLLGLCLGFSVLSLIEIIYFFSLRVCCRIFAQRKPRKKTDKTVIPFAR